MTTIDVLTQAANALSEAAFELVYPSGRANWVAIRAVDVMKLVDAEVVKALDGGLIIWHDARKAKPPYPKSKKHAFTGKKTGKKKGAKK